MVESRLSYHLRCLTEDATDPEQSCVERPTLVRERAGRIREIRQELDHAKGRRAAGRHLTAEKIRRKVVSTA